MTALVLETPTGRKGRNSPAPWDDPAIIRAELYSDELLNRHAVTLADAEVVVARARPGGGVRQPL